MCILKGTCTHAFTCFSVRDKTQTLCPDCFFWGEEEGSVACDGWHHTASCLLEDTCSFQEWPQQKAHSSTPGSTAPWFGCHSSVQPYLSSLEMGQLHGHGHGILQGHKDAPLSPKCQQAPCQMSRAGIVNPCRQRHSAQADLLGSLFPCYPQNQLARRHRWGFACKKRDTAAQHHASATTSSTLLQLL